MRLIFGIIVFLHALIHITGLIKAYQLAELNQLATPISRQMGILWLICFIAYILVFVFWAWSKAWWWMPAIPTVILSQALLISVWQDAKFGTIPNVIVLIAIIYAISGLLSHKQIEQELKSILPHSQDDKINVITENMIQKLPYAIQKWLWNAGMVGKESIQTVHLKQSGLMKLKPDQKKWFTAAAEQYVATDRPAFLWTVNMRLFPLVHVYGSDMLHEGEASMEMKIGNVIKLVDEKNNNKINQSSLQRYLLELPWYPSAALSPYIKWDEVDAHTAIATLSYQGVSGTATYLFDQNGDLLKVSAFRYKDSNKDAPLVECIGEVKENKSFQGITIPSKMNVSWVLENGLFTWYQIEIDDIRFNEKAN